MMGMRMMMRWGIHSSGTGRLETVRSLFRLQGGVTNTEFRRQNLFNFRPYGVTGARAIQHHMCAEHGLISVEGPHVKLMDGRHTRDPPNDVMKAANVQTLGGKL